MLSICQKWIYFFNKKDKQENKNTENRQTPDKQTEKPQDRQFYLGNSCMTTSGKHKKRHTYKNEKYSVENRKKTEYRLINSLFFFVFKKFL